MANKTWWFCDNCNKKLRHPHKSKGKFLCYPCYKKTLTEIPKVETLFQAVDKVYTIKNIGIKKPRGICYFPPILVGKKFKIQVVGGE